MKRLAIIGAGDLGRQIQHHAQQTGKYSPICFFDDTRPKQDTENGLTIKGNVNEIEPLYRDNFFDCLIVAIGYRHMKIRAELFQRFYGEIPFATIIHPHAYIDPSAMIEEGSVIYPGCIIDMNVVIEGNVLLNTGCVIAHDSVVQKHSFLSPAVKLAGFVTIAESVVLGINTTVIDNIKVSKNIHTGGGAVVIDNLVQPGLYAGVPAILKKKYDTL